MKPAIIIQTDFTKDIASCAMEGVFLMVDPELRTYENTHDIPSFNTYAASVSLDYIVNYWPKGTIFVSVVDPGVGTSRKGCVAKLKNGCYVVTPDNGSLAHVKLNPGIECVREIDETINRLPESEGVNIFHGRDVFAYTAARLASGIIAYEEVGQAYPVEDIIEHKFITPTVKDGVISGMITLTHPHFGLVCSNVPMDVFKDNNIVYGDVLDVSVTYEGKEVYHEEVPYHPSFGSVAKGMPLLMNSETRTIQMAINQGNMANRYGIKDGADWLISFKKI